MAEVADLPPRPAGVAGELGPAHRQLPGLGAQQGREHAQQGALARPVGTEQGQALPRRQVHVDAVDRPAIAEGLHQAAAADQDVLRYSVTAARVKSRYTHASRPLDCPKAAWMRPTSPGRTIAFSYSSTAAQTATPSM